MSPIINIPSTAGSNIDRWIRDTAAAVNELAAENTVTIFTWNRGCVTVPTSTDIDGAEQLVFQSAFTGNGTLVITVFDAEGGVNVALNGVELGSLTGAASQEVLYEVPVTNLVEGDDPLNVFKIWSTTADTAELRKLEVYRNFTREQISDSSIWGNITGTGKPADDATVGADFQTNLTNKPKDTFNLWADPQFELGSGALESLNAAHTLVSDPLSKFNGAIQLAGSTANKKSILITVPASAGQTIFTEWWAHKDGSVNSGADVGLTFRWVDGADEQISQTTDLQDESAMSTGAWTKFTGSSIAPANTATVGLRVENRTSHTAGNFFLTMVSFRSATPALWDDVSGAAKPADNATNTTGALGDLDTVSATEIDDDAVTTAKIAALAVNSAKLAADAVTNAKLAAAAVDTAEMIDNAISITAFAVDTTLTPDSATFVTILTLSLTNGTSDVVELVISTKNANLTINDANVVFRVLRNEGSDVTVFERDWTIVGDFGTSANTKAYVFMDDAPTGGGTITYKLQYKLVGTSDDINDRVREIYFRARQMKK